ncbi:hypothetical protein ASZ78_008678 [Callipepla squamata]|uniref:BHLH domain-containing protein n=1 Tax=Callipepla squamata TaxID=9009 RepID=A0A226N692_CALSU|nr:hypothetical protein ASZ78_008678 [Callipepla squamata]
MKRPCEETTSDSDMDETIDVGSENNYCGQSHNSVLRPNSPTTTSQIMARKKRRGIIEKRRRDRINNSLSELRRLVPTAFEKQGSAKLEKAEILQMTVDHLKMLQATGGKGKERMVSLLLLGEISEEIALTSCDRRFQIKGVEINANGRIELVGKNYWDKRST